MKLYPPNGGQVAVDAHPSKIDQMKANGWTEQPAKAKRRRKAAADESPTEQSATVGEENEDNG